MDWALFRKLDIIGKDPETGEPTLYLRRWLLVRTPWFQVMLHKINRPDADRHLHDHPWAFRSLILKGGYVEDVCEKTRFGTILLRAKYWRENTLGDFVGHDQHTFHRIDRLLNGPAWTLVFTTGKKKPWGFLVDGKWVHNEVYLGGKSDNELLQDDW